MPSVTSVYTSLSLISLAALVGTGVAIGSGVSMMSLNMMEAEAPKKATVASPKETPFHMSRGFAAGGSA